MADMFEGIDEGQASVATAEPEQKDWFIEGKFKTKEDWAKHNQEQQAMITRLQMQSSEQAKALKELEGKVPAQTQQPTKSQYEKIQEEMGITDDQLLFNGKENHAKIMAEHERRMRAEFNSQINFQVGSLKINAIADKVQEKFPDFNIQENGQRISDLLKSKYSQSYINQNTERLIFEAAKELGGKPKPETNSAANGANASDQTVYETQRKNSQETWEKNFKAGIKNAGSKPNVDIFRNAKRNSTF